eukprot:symbB.v1.2.023426.t2/scaffold2141.1/size89931/3
MSWGGYGEYGGDYGDYGEYGGYGWGSSSASGGGWGQWSGGKGDGKTGQWSGGDGYGSQPPGASWSGPGMPPAPGPMAPTQLIPRPPAPGQTGSFAKSSGVGPPMGAATGQTFMSKQAAVVAKPPPAVVPVPRSEPWQAGPLPEGSQDVSAATAAP